MPIPRETNYPDYGYGGPGSPGNAHIPVLFSGKLLQKFYAKCVATNITVSDYIGELKNVGDRVVIRTIPNVTIKDYKKGATLELEYPESPAIELTVNRAKYFNFAMDDIDIKESDLNWIDAYSNDAAQQLKIVQDTEFFASIYAKADANNQGDQAGAKTHAFNLGKAGAPVTLTKDNILEVLTDCATVLDEQNIPEENRWIVLPPIVFGLINKSDLKAAYFEGSDKSLLLRGGFVGGSIAGLNVYKSNNLYWTTDTVDSNTIKTVYIPFGWKGCAVYVAQITKTEVYRPQDTFADAVKGLCVYDFDVVQPTGLGVLYATI